jgi:hypothetical protein
MFCIANDSAVRNTDPVTSSTNQPTVRRSIHCASASSIAADQRRVYPGAPNARSARGFVLTVVAASEFTARL